MKKFLTGKKAMALAVVAALAVAVSAYAYWTANGTGSGSASVGTDSGVTIENVSISGDLYPGHDLTVNGDVKNDSADAPAKVGDVVADDSDFVNGVEVDATHATAGCQSGDFSFDDVTLNYEIAESGTKAFTGALAMANSSSNQDACKGATLTLHLKVDNSAL
jgi:hypothetical protein